MYLVKEVLRYEVTDSETYNVVKTFAAYEKDKAALYAQDANAIIINEDSKNKQKIAKLEKELETLRDSIIP